LDEEAHFAYKNHVRIDRQHRLVRRFAVTSASVHDSQKLDDLLDPTNTASGVGRQRLSSRRGRGELAAPGIKNRLHGRGTQGRPLTPQQEAANKARPSVRARVKHVFPSMQTSMGGKLVRTIGIARAKMKVGMQNLAYNMCRLVAPDRIGCCIAPESARSRHARPDRQENCTRTRGLISTRFNIDTSGRPSAPEAARGNPECQLFKTFWNRIGIKFDISCQLSKAQRMTASKGRLLNDVGISSLTRAPTPPS
jgi:hypothetical protein